jgi:hypothetical protein
MTHNPPVRRPDHWPPRELWPTTTPPDCTGCERPDDVEWNGYAHLLDHDHDALMWFCNGCCAEWGTLTTHWPVNDGPDCPVCDSPATRWTDIDPDHLGDTWTCDAGHEFVLDPEGFVYVPSAGDAA